MFNRGSAFAVIVALVATIAVVYKDYFKPTFNYTSPEILRKQIETAFMDTWNDYSKHGWGYDVYGPLSHSHSNMPRSDDPMGWIIVDSIDTMMLMYNSSTTHKEEFLKAIENAENWVANDLSYDIDAEISIFETTIRMLGGLLSAYHYSTEFKIGNPDTYLSKAIDLCDRLSLAFSATDTGIPYSSINLHTGESVKNHVDNGASSTAEFTTLQLEFKYMSFLTGNKTYWELAEQVYPPLYKENDLLGSYDGLAPIYTFPDNGKFFGSNIRMGSRGDSFYEYLLKQYLLTHEELYYDLYRGSIQGMKKYLVAESKPNGLIYIGEKPHGLSNTLSTKMDHLVCFMGGLMGMGATEGFTIAEARKQPFWDGIREEDWKLAEGLTHSCYQMYKQMPSGLSPEIVVFNDGNLDDEAERGKWWKSPTGDFFVKPLDAHNLQRPETVESIMFMYHLSGDEKYRQWGQEIFESFQDHATVTNDDGTTKTYVSLDNCIRVPTIKRDGMESFWLAETLKYLYLLFEDDVDLKKIVFNTEAHPFPVLDVELLKKKNLTTGWSL